ncbi:WD40 repeat-like protein [Dentipellis sp. KUC8613]|nr:WD40 repeat-like protein [Dentipellis sp. KUC8613]
MASRSKLKTAFKKARTIAPLYTGGPVAITPDGHRLVTCLGEEALLTDLDRGTEICRFVGDTESITALCITPSGKQVLLFTSSMSLRIFDLPPPSSEPLSAPLHPTRVIARAHDAPVHVCKVDPTSTYLASGAADGTVKVWDIARGFPTHVLRGHGGVVSALAWSFPVLGLGVDLGERTMRLVTGSVDTRVRVWDLAKCAEEAKAGKSARPEAVLEGHVSVPRGLDVSADGRWLVSGGRDAVVLVWDMKAKAEKKSKGKGKAREGPVLVKTVTALERVEAVGLLEEEEEVVGSSEGSKKLRFYTAGEKGVVRVWDGKDGSVIWTFGEEHPAAASEDQEEQRQILDAIYVPSTATIISIHADQNLLFHSLPTGSLSRQLIGFNDEIIDATFLRTPSAPSSSEIHIALATNSSLIRLYSTRTLDARLLSGHTDIVLSLASSASGTVLASGGKDRSARLWAPVPTPSTSANAHQDWACVAHCEGHAGSIGALAFARQTGAAGGLKFMFTGSQDRTIKMWDLSSIATTAEEGTEPAQCHSLCTHKAHDKDINALDVAPTDALLASGSQDRTAKVYTITYAAAAHAGGHARGELTLLGTCRGHKRGVWSVRFARHERVLATGGGDRTVRLWGLDKFECLRVLEGHSNSVLRVDWIVGSEGGRSGGGEVVSAGADGLVKVWDVRGEECVATLDGHEDKVWALAVSADGKRIVSGAADSVVTFWEDCTEEEDKKREEARAEMALKEQDFLNYVALQDYQRAIELALSLEHPGRLYSLFKDLASNATIDPTAQQPSITGHPAVDTVLRTLHPTDLARLLGYIRTWNARASTSAIAQRVLHALVSLRPAEDIPADVLEALIPYTERHLARVERLVRESYVVDFVLGEMDMHAEFEEDGDDDRMDVDMEGSRAVGVGA